MTERSAGIIPIHRDTGDILLVQNSPRLQAIRNSVSNAGHWGFPKGGIEEGESLQQTALRELKEETGLTLLSLDQESITERYFFEINESVVEKAVTYFIGLVENRNVILQESELQGFAWLPYPEAIERLTFKEARGVLESARERIALLTNR